MKLKFVLVFFLSFAPILVFAQSKAVKTIIRLQDLRAKPASFAPYLKSNNSEVAERALLALGSVQDPEATSYILEILDHPNPAVRRAAGFALSQSGNTTVFPIVKNRVLTETDQAAKQEFARAAGKLASLGEAEILLDALLSRNDQLAAAEFITRLSIRPLVSEKILASGEKLLNSEDVKVLSLATYALNRFKKPENWFSSVASQHSRLSTSPSAQVRMGWASLLGSAQDTAIISSIGSWLSKEPSPEVRSNLVRSAGRIKSTNTFRQISVLSSAMSDPIPMVQMAAQLSLLPLIPEKNTPEFEYLTTVLGARLFAVSNPLSKTDIDWMILSAKAGLPFYESLLQQLGSHPNPVLRAYQSSILAETGNPAAFTNLRTLLSDESVPVKTLAATGLMTLSRTLSLPAVNVKPDITLFLESKDMALISIAGEALAEKRFQYPGFEKDLVNILKGLDPINDVEAIQSVINTLGPIAGTEIDSVFGALSGSTEKAISSLAIQWIGQRSGVSFTVRPLVDTEKPDLPDLSELESVWNGKWLEIKTNKGIVILELLPKEAPLTCLRMVEFAKEGYFDGLFFHRLVPNFVIQGGDPRGDGWGGPGLSMRSEFSTVKYAQEGMVGMASAGKDTEGSQFFIVHSATPHLDGRYTIWAKVVSGMTVVQQLEIGDKMETVKVLNSLPLTVIPKEVKKRKRK
ncbi:MAG: peptidylprolyl isomerase [Bacteroidetes bacterium]|nr:peptidylprolyl isomerase [Bacteroidota bacterium]